jgi:hypothetical protein
MANPFTIHKILVLMGPLWNVEHGVKLAFTAKV